MFFGNGESASNYDDNESREEIDRNDSESREEIDQNNSTISTSSEERDAHNDPDYIPENSIDMTNSNRPSTRNNPLNFFNAYFALFNEITTFNEASNGVESEKWKKAMEAEIESLNENGTWKLVDLPKGKKPIRNKWVFKMKTDANGIIIRYKARLVAKGCSQKEGIDYNEIYSPVVRYASIRYLISIAVQFDLIIYQMDALTAFLQGVLEEEIYMEQPEGYNDGSDKVCLLKKINLWLETGK